MPDVRDADGASPGSSPRPLGGRPTEKTSRSTHPRRSMSSFVSSFSPLTRCSAAAPEQIAPPARPGSVAGSPREGRPSPPSSFSSSPSRPSWRLPRHRRPAAQRLPTPPPARRLLPGLICIGVGRRTTQPRRVTHKLWVCPSSGFVLLCEPHGVEKDRGKGARLPL